MEISALFLMVLDKLGDSLKTSIKKLLGSALIDEKLVEEIIKDIQRALIQADVDVKLVFELSNKIRDSIKKAKKGFSKKEQVVEVIYNSLVSLVGTEGAKLQPKGKGFVVMLVGLFGSGKTTTASKLAKFYMKRGYRVGLLGLDTFRPAAMEQLEQLGKAINAPVFVKKGEKKAEKVIKEFKDEFKKFDVILADSAGRDALDKELVKEIKGIDKALNPNETLLVMPADIGQNAKTQAQAFSNALKVSGVIITKLDGTAKGGGALTACAVTRTPVKFIGIGERVDDLEEFEPKRFISRLLGMGDLESLLEKAKESFDEEKAEDLAKKMMSGKFNLIDLREQLDGVSKMGSISKLTNLIPGMGMAKIPKGALEVQEEKLKIFKILMDSMTKDELENPDKITSKRIERIAKGSGRTTSDVKELLTQYRQMRKLMKGMSGGKMKKIMRQFGIKDMRDLEGVV
jgi:signal recognition particle subunit SRP54